MHSLHLKHLHDKVTLKIAICHTSSTQMKTMTAPMHVTSVRSSSVCRKIVCFISCHWVRVIHGNPCAKLHTRSSFFTVSSDAPASLTILPYVLETTDLLLVSRVQTPHHYLRQVAQHRQTNASLLQSCHNQYSFTSQPHMDIIRAFLHFFFFQLFAPSALYFTLKIWLLSNKRKIRSQLLHNVLD